MDNCNDHLEKNDIELKRMVITKKMEDQKLLQEKMKIKEDILKINTWGL